MDARASRLPLVDSLRAIAALSVLVFHALGIFGGALNPGVLVRPFIDRLDVSVSLFLAVSGFLLYRPFVHAHLQAQRAPSTRGFAWRRFLRIVPAYWVALAIAAVAVPLPEVLSGHGPLIYFGFGQVYRASTLGRGDSPAWTLGLEVSFYALLPFWAMLIRRLGTPPARALRAQCAGVVVLIAGSLIYKALLFATGAVSHIPTSPVPALVTLPGYLDELGVGMGLAVLSVWLEGRDHPRWLSVVDRRPGLAWGFAGALFALVSLGIGLNGSPGQMLTPLQYELRNVLYGLIALALLLPTVFGDPRRGAVRRVLGNRLLLWLGLISYGLYVWHWPVLVAMAGHGYGNVAPGLERYLLWGSLPVAAAIALGAASYYLVERPALSLKRLVTAYAGAPGDATLEPAPATPPRCSEDPQ